MIILYRGVGGTWSPHADHVEALITARLKTRGFKGKRTGKGSIHASPDLTQARDYARNGAEENVLCIAPLPGAVVSWVPGVADVLLSFEGFVRDRYWNGSRCPILRDAQGDLGVLDTYLSMGRQKAAIGRHIDAFLDTIAVQEIVMGADTDLAAELGTHNGEVWVTGPHAAEPYAAPAAVADAEERLGM